MIDLIYPFAMEVDDEDQLLRFEILMSPKDSYVQDLNKFQIRNIAECRVRQRRIKRIQHYTNSEDAISWKDAQEYLGIGIKYIPLKLEELTEICDRHGIDPDHKKWKNDDIVMIKLSLPTT